MKIKNLWVAVDDNEDKIVFLCRVKSSEEDRRPKVIAYLFSLAKIFQKMFLGGVLKFQEDQGLIYKSPLTYIQDYGPKQFKFKTSFFNREFGIFVCLANRNTNEQREIGENLTHLIYLHRTSLFSGKEVN